MIGYRKTSVALLYLVLSAVLILYGKVDGTEWLKYTAGILGTFMGTNLVEHWGKK